MANNHINGHDKDVEEELRLLRQMTKTHENTLADLRAECLDLRHQCMKLQYESTELHRDYTMFKAQFEERLTNATRHAETYVLERIQFTMHHVNQTLKQPITGQPEPTAIVPLSEVHSGCNSSQLRWVSEWLEHETIANPTLVWGVGEAFANYSKFLQDHEGLLPTDFIPYKKFSSVLVQAFPHVKKTRGKVTVFRGIGPK